MARRRHTVSYQGQHLLSHLPQLQPTPILPLLHGLDRSKAVVSGLHLLCCRHLLPSIADALVHALSLCNNSQGMTIGGAIGSLQQVLLQVAALSPQAWLHHKSSAVKTGSINALFRACTCAGARSACCSCSTWVFSMATCTNSLAVKILTQPCKHAVTDLMAVLLAIT